ncbi:hypothetical protein FCN77_22065 [Arthrobacter sp. 24S4-2]|uniref:hypothetical protein n=1 Tax=Arthrobacter sp. 24S4-2 TaxID=2575374 RepID=UPI0010C7C0F7|nr:hypothetical protein [Arthrobacter sp. 24S4-2]QCO99909.1 hypothetical protein FCN77_22065 [Arthrobacter sp. 24S4-2]
MSTEHNEPEDIVSDGVEDKTSPLPKEKPAGQASGRHAASGPADSGPAGAGGTKPPGPAEEQNSETGDNRGLTTEPSSSD